jgi:hypothetical protein
MLVPESRPSTAGTAAHVPSPRMAWRQSHVRFSEARGCSGTASTYFAEARRDCLLGFSLNSGSLRATAARVAREGAPLPPPRTLRVRRRR